MDLRQLRAAWQSDQLAKRDFIAQMHVGHSMLFQFPELLADSTIDRIEITSDGVVFVSQSGLRFTCSADDQRAAPIEAINFGSYESQDEQLFFSLCRSGHTLIDVGAHIGWYSIHVATKYPKSTVVAIEPAPESARLLRHNVRLNKLNNVEIVEVACADFNGDTNLFIPKEWPTASSTANILGTSQAITVQSRRLDDLVAERGLKVDIIKIDVEGGELAVLRGSESVLQNQRPIVFCEMLRKWSACHGRHPNQLLDWMTSLGYRCNYLGPNGLTRLLTMTDDITATNYVFLHESRQSP